MTVEKVHAKSLMITVAGGVVSICLSTWLGWMSGNASVNSALRETISANTAKIQQLQKDIVRLDEADSTVSQIYMTKAQFMQFATMYQDHWREQHDFQSRIDQEMVELIKQHARMMEILNQSGLSRRKPTSTSDLPWSYNPER